MSRYTWTRRLVLERSFVHEEFVVAIWSAGKRSCEIRLNELT